MITITTTQIGIVLGLISIVGTVIGIIFWIQKPVSALEKKVQTLEEELTATKKDLQNVKDSHSESNTILTKGLKENTEALNKVNVEMTRLSTIIEERIPKGQPNLTPPGQ